MNILYVYDGEWPKGATRIRKETRVMAAAGHVVSLLVRNGEYRPTTERESWMKVWRLPRIPWRPLRYALNFPLFVNPIWLWAMWRVARRTRPHLLVVCDLPLAPCVVWLGRWLEIPVHYDMAEVYPEFLRSLRALERQGPLKRILRTPAAAAAVERWVLRRIDTLYSVSEESRMRAIALGVNPRQVVIIGNTPEHLPDLGQPASIPVDIEDLVRARQDILLFVGILIADRGVLDAIRALPTPRRRCPKACLVVVGDGPARQQLAEEIRELRLQSDVRMVGWKEPEELEAYYRAATIGLLPFRNSPHVRLTLANKLFDDMAAGLPVLGSDLPPTHRILEQTGAGRLHLPDEPADLAHVAADMLEDREATRNMGALGRRAAETDYSWRHDADRLTEAISRAAPARGAPSPPKPGWSP